MPRLLLLLGLVFAVLALAGAAVTALSRAARESRALARDLVPTQEGSSMKQVSYVALLLLMLGVTSGLLGGL